jgi:hypothetical protein
MVKLKQLSREQIVAKRLEAFKKLRLPFVLFSLASIVLVEVLPGLLHVSGSRPNVLQLSAIGIVIIILSALFIWWSSRLLRLSAAWAILITLFLSVVAVIKFILVPSSLYSQTYRVQQGAILPTDFDPNKIATYLGVSIAVFFTYAIIFWIYYRTYRKKVFALKLAPNSLETQKKFGKLITNVILLVIALVVISTMSGGTIVLLAVPLSLFDGVGQYLQTIFENGGLLLLFLLVIAVIFAFKSIQVSAHESISTKRPAVIVICAWIALSVLLMYQIVWIIYMTVLFTLAPFKVIYFSSK